MPISRKRINDVFTPRNPDVNQTMYIHRTELERALRDAIEGTLHALVHGESGCGKSWLYKKVLGDARIDFIVVNLANASRFGGISKEMANIVSRVGQTRKTGYTETKGAEVSVAVAKGSLEHEGQYEISQSQDPLEDCLRLVRKQADKKQACVVLDNLEAIFDSEALMRELGDIIILLDDARYSAYRVKFLIVGIPADVRDYFAKLRNRETVSNRIQEIPEVKKLTEGQVAEFVKKGFCDELKVDFDGVLLNQFQYHVYWVTDGVPQRVHEYCLELARLVEDNDWRPELAQLQKADGRWLKSALSSNYTVVEGLMNERETRAGRRNQVLYALGQVAGDTFRYTDIEEIVRVEFSESTQGVTLDIAGVLAQIANSRTPPIKRTAKGDSYRFVDPKFRMCVRTMLSKEGERVSKLDFSTL